MSCGLLLNRQTWADMPQQRSVGQVLHAADDGYNCIGLSSISSDPPPDSVFRPPV